MQIVDEKTLHMAEGCPKLQNQLNPELKLSYNLTDEVTAVNDLILKDSKIVTTSTLIKEMKQILHTAHQGIERTKSNARSRMYSSNIDKDVDEIINNCNARQKYRNLIPRESLLLHEITK